MACRPTNMAAWHSLGEMLDRIRICKLLSYSEDRGRIEPTSRLHVSRGIRIEQGFEIPVRFLCPPEICVLDMGRRSEE
jgi:predicted MPP superfamily phosphohydrolase